MYIVRSVTAEIRVRDVALSYAHKYGPPKWGFFNDLIFRTHEQLCMIATDRHRNTIIIIIIIIIITIAIMIL